MAVVVPAAILDAIRAHARAAYPEECCGLLAGRSADGDFLIDEAGQSANVTDGDPRRGFEIDPQLRFDMMRSAEARGAAVIGHYHSHPDHPAEPSETDLAKAYEPDLVWLICGVQADGKAADRTTIRAFKARPDRSAFDEIAIRESP